MSWPGSGRVWRPAWGRAWASEGPSLLTTGDRIVYEGDSITDYDNSNGHSHQYLALAMAGGRLYYPTSSAAARGGNQAVGGQQIGPRGNNPTTWMADATQVAAVVAQKPDVVVFLGGTNDIARGDLNAAAIFADLQTCLAGYFAGGAKYVVVGTVIPHNTFGDAGWTGAMETARLALNTAIRGLPATDARIKVADYAAAAWDLTAGLSNYQPDGVHPNFIGMRLIADIQAAALNSIIDSTSAIAAYTDASNLMLAANNPQMVGTAGTASGGTGTAATTGGIATSWDVRNNAPGITVVASKSTLADGTAAQRLVLSGTQSGASGSVRLSTAVPFNGVAGENYEALMAVELDAGATNLRGLILTSQNCSSLSSGSAYDMSAGGLTGVIRTRCTAPLSGTVTTNQFRMTIQLGTATASPTAVAVKFGKPVFRKVTAIAPQ